MALPAGASRLTCVLALSAFHFSGALREVVPGISGIAVSPFSDTDSSTGEATSVRGERDDVSAAEAIRTESREPREPRSRFAWSNVGGGDWSMGDVVGSVNDHEADSPGNRELLPYSPGAWWSVFDGGGGSPGHVSGSESGTDDANEDSFDRPGTPLMRNPAGIDEDGPAVRAACPDGAEADKHGMCRCLPPLGCRDPDDHLDVHSHCGKGVFDSEACPSCVCAERTVSWHAGPWGECIGVCGENMSSGLLNRNVTCRYSDRAEDEEELPEELCKPDERPEDVSACSLPLACKGCLDPLAVNVVNVAKETLAKVIEDRSVCKYPVAPLRFPSNVMDNPECSPKGHVTVEGFMALSENKDTLLRGINSAEVGALPVGLKGPVHITLSNDLDYNDTNLMLEVFDAAQGVAVVSALLNRPPEVTFHRFGANITVSWGDNKQEVKIEPSIPSAWLLRVAMGREGQSQEDRSGRWVMNVAWDGSSESESCWRALTRAVSVPQGVLEAIHTDRYTPFMPGFLAVFRRNAKVTLELGELGESGRAWRQEKATKFCKGLMAEAAHMRHYRFRQQAVLQCQEWFPRVWPQAACEEKIGAAVRDATMAVVTGCKLEPDPQRPRCVPEGFNDTAWEAARASLDKELCQNSSQASATTMDVFGLGCQVLADGACAAEENPPDRPPVFTIRGSVELEDGDLDSWTVKVPATAAESESHNGRRSWTLALPADLPVGRAGLYVDGQFLGAVAIIFNPWSPEEDVFLSADALRRETRDAEARRRLDGLKGYDDDEARRDYVLKTDTFIYMGTADNGLGNIFADPWNLHQFRSLYYLLPLLDMLPPKIRKSPQELARKMPLLMNKFVLRGNWNDTSDGEDPDSWSSAAEIFRRSHKMALLRSLPGGDSTVRYGQCFVFGGILGSALRSIGIPSRVVTNFRSAHDRPPYDWVIREDQGDSVWNFHVWNEAWMRRPDLGPSRHRDGVMANPAEDTVAQWNVLDATPQEMSEGMPLMGPAAMNVVRRGADDVGRGAHELDGWWGQPHANARIPWDVAFAVGEVNAAQTMKADIDRDDELQLLLLGEENPESNITCSYICEVLSGPGHPFQPGMVKQISELCAHSCHQGDKRELLNFHAIGKYISTEHPRCSGESKSKKVGSVGIADPAGCREDLTANYKEKACPTWELCDVMAKQRADKIRFDVPMFLTVSPKVPQIGDTVTIELSSEQALDRYVQLRLHAVSYDGKQLHEIGKISDEWTGAAPFSVQLTPDIYTPMLRETSFLEIDVAAFPTLESNQVEEPTFRTKKTVELKAPRPALRFFRQGAAQDLASGEEPARAGDTIDVEVEWRNPLWVTLTQCAMAVDDSEVGDLAGKLQGLPDVPAGGTIKARAKEGILLGQAGSTTIVAVLLCKELGPARGYASVDVEEGIEPLAEMMRLFEQGS